MALSASGIPQFQDRRAGSSRRRFMSVLPREPMRRENRVRAALLDAPSHIADEVAPNRPGMRRPRCPWPCRQWRPRRNNVWSGPRPASSGGLRPTHVRGRPSASSATSGKRLAPGHFHTASLQSALRRHMAFWRLVCGLSEPGLKGELFRQPRHIHSGVRRRPLGLRARVKHFRRDPPD